MDESERPEWSVGKVTEKKSFLGIGPLFEGQDKYTFPVNGSSPELIKRYCAAGPHLHPIRSRLFGFACSQLTRLSRLSLLFPLYTTHTVITTVEVTTSSYVGRPTDFPHLFAALHSLSCLSCRPSSFCCPSPKPTALCDCCYVTVTAAVIKSHDYCHSLSGAWTIRSKFTAKSSLNLLVGGLLADAVSYIPARNAAFAAGD